MMFSGKRDDVAEGPEPRDYTVYRGNWQQFSLVGVWPLGEESGTR